MRLAGYIASFVSIVLLLTSCEKSYLGGRYKITGVLYDTDGVTPLGNKELTLSGHNFNNFRNYSSDIKTVETDNNGFFEIPYWHNRKAGYLRISHSGGVLLSSITPNKDLERDLCLKGIGYVHFDIQIDTTLGKDDSLYIHVWGVNPFTTVKTKFVNILTYPFTEELKLFNKVEHSWNRRGAQGNSIRWGIGFKDFELNGSGKFDTDDPNFKEYYFEGFPHVDTVEIVID